MKSLCQVSSSYGLYDKDVTIVKKLGRQIKVVNLNAIRIKGLVDDRRHISTRNNKVNDEKMENNLSRAKTKLKEYALCNDWEYFCTFTINKEKYDRYNLKAYYKDFSKFINNYNYRRKDGGKFTYVLVPELHEDGAWHMHGLIKGIIKDEMYINKYGYMTWSKYEENFGFISMGYIKNIDKTANYIMKYITKDQEKNVTELGNHLYYCSNKLNTAETIYTGKVSLKCSWGFEGEYCKVKNFKTYDDFEKYAELL